MHTRVINIDILRVVLLFFVMYGDDVVDSRCLEEFFVFYEDFAPPR